MSGKLSSWRFSNPDLRQIYSRCRETLHNFQNLTALNRLHRATPRQTLASVFTDALDEAGTRHFLARHPRMRGFSFFLRRFKGPRFSVAADCQKHVCAELYAPSPDKSRCNDRSQHKSRSKAPASAAKTATVTTTAKERSLMYLRATSVRAV